MPNEFKKQDDESSNSAPVAQSEKLDVDTARDVALNAVNKFPANRRQKQVIVNMVEKDYLARQDSDGGDQIIIGNDKFHLSVERTPEHTPDADYVIEYGSGHGLETSIEIRKREEGWEIKRYVFESVGPDEPLPDLDMEFRLQDESNFSEVTVGDAQNLIHILQANEGRQVREATLA